VPAPDRTGAVSTPSYVGDRQVLWFGLLAFALTWAAWLPLATDAQGWTTLGASPYLHLVGGLGPAVAAVTMTAVYDGRPGLRLLRARATTGPARYLALVIVAPALAYALALGIATLVGAAGDASLTGASQEYPALPLGVYWVASLVCYGYGEELGWRGFALPRLQRTRPALAASLWLAVLWGAWHLPLFLFSAGLGTMPRVGLIGWAASIVTGAVICTWLFNASGGSIAVLALFHACLDILITSPTGGDVLQNVMGATVVIAALVIPRRYGRERLARSAKVTWTVERAPCRVQAA
jgi:membrane protease YdiL (CAAX protease family)